MAASKKKEKTFSISMIDEGLSANYFRGLDRLLKERGFQRSLEEFISD